jgi:heterodisulfide reductase subunit B
MELQGKKRIWEEYQKEIADDHYFYVRSCIRQTFFPGSESTFLRILRDVLGKDVFEDARHTTCTGIGYHTDIVPFDTIMTIVARHFSLMTEAGYVNFVPSCVTSFGIYTEVLNTWKHFPETEAKAREFLWKATRREFEKPVNLAHTSDIIYKFRNEIMCASNHQLVSKKDGKPLKVVEHIGCHYSKMFPKSGVGGAEFPAVLSGMVNAWGGTVIDYPERRHCCGFGFRQYLIQANRGYSLSNSKKKFDSMQPYHPDFIVANCPGCAMFLDRWQYAIAEMDGVTYDKAGKGIPVLTYEEMAGLVLGYSPWEMGLQMHQISVESLMDEIGIEYNKNEKYLGSKGLYISKPQQPQFLLQ